MPKKDIVEHVSKEGEYLEYAEDIIARSNPPLNMIENAYSALRLLAELTGWELVKGESDPELLRRKKESHFAMMKQLVGKPSLDEIIRVAERNGANDSDVDEGVRAYNLRIDYVMKAQTLNSKYDPKAAKDLNAKRHKLAVKLESKIPTPTAQAGQNQNNQQSSTPSFLSSQKLLTIAGLCLTAGIVYFAIQQYAKKEQEAKKKHRA